jgi:hypothetical protein
MTATVNVYELNGAAPGTPTSKTSGTVRFKNADNATVDLNNPLLVPGANFDSSFQKWLRLRIDGGSFTQISNLRAYTDGVNTFGTGVMLYAIGVGPTYVQPDEPSGAVAPPQFPSTGSPTVAMVDIFTYTSGSPLDLDAITAGPFVNGSPTEYIGDFIVMVMQIASTAAQGVLTAETLTFAYDEI